jgi:hypothetical protein
VFGGKETLFADRRTMFAGVGSVLARVCGVFVWAETMFAGDGNHVRWEVTPCSPGSMPGFCKSLM